MVYGVVVDAGTCSRPPAVGGRCCLSGGHVTGADARVFSMASVATAQLRERESEFGRQRRVQHEVGRTVDDHQQIGDGRCQSKVDGLQRSRRSHDVRDHEADRRRNLTIKSIWHNVNLNCRFGTAYTISYGE